jgi:hypothetical protein
MVISASSKKRLESPLIIFFILKRKRVYSMLEKFVQSLSLLSSSHNIQE